MENSKIILSQEVEFAFDEIFFSVTDRRGIILEGNNVFVRVSGYPKKDLLSKPHNIIRHPDMPKCVFELLWKKILAGESIVAYVKNKDINGKYYWVLSTVLPIKDGFLSIRIKPNGSYFLNAQKLYTDVLAKENKEGAKHSLDYMIKEISNLGFSNYEEFMVKSLSSEIYSNKILLESKFLKKNKLNTNFMHVTDLFYEKEKKISVMLERLKKVVNTAPNLKSKTNEILNSCIKLDYISLNMSINSGNLGQQTASISIISREFQKMVSVIRALVKKFQGISVQLNLNIETIEFGVLLIFLQNKSLENFLSEYFESHIEKSLETDERENLLISLEKNLNLLIDTLLDSYQNKTFNYLNNTVISCKKLATLSEELKAKIFSLEISKDLSKIEISRNKKIEGYFDNQIQEIHDFIATSKENIEEIQKSTSIAMNEVFYILEVLQEYVEFIKILMKKIKSNELKNKAA